MHLLENETNKTKNTEYCFTDIVDGIIAAWYYLDVGDASPIHIEQHIFPLRPMQFE
jgi:hypothetical protein